jgi:hypothetical protein
VGDVTGIIAIYKYNPNPRSMNPWELLFVRTSFDGVNGKAILHMVSLEVHLYLGRSLTKVL